MDYFIRDTNCINRLIEDWQKHGSIIVAYDYDNTVYDYHGKGYKFPVVISLLRESHRLGFHLIVFTASVEEQYESIERFLRENEIPFDGINTPPPGLPFNGMKPYYNILLDDRAGLKSAVNHLSELINYIKYENKPS